MEAGSKVSSYHWISSYFMYLCKTTMKFTLQTFLLVTTVFAKIKEARATNENDKISCTLYAGVGETADDESEESISCIDDDGISHPVTNINPAFFGLSESMDMTEITMFIAGQNIKLDVEQSLMSSEHNLSLIIDMNNTDAFVQVNPMKPRQLKKAKGNQNVAVIRVTSGDGYSPQYTASEMSENIFGLNDSYNLVSAYPQCSGGQLTFQKGIGQNLIDGVLDVTIEQSLNGVNILTAQNYVTAYLNGIGFNVYTYDHVMYAFPSQITGYIAYAYYNSYLSLYESPWESRPSTQLHEIGHNFNMRHSGQDSDQYGDQTCFMGYSYSDLDGPIMCFNAAKSYVFGWYSDAHLDVEPMNTGNGIHAKMVSVDDYLNNNAGGANEYAVARVQGSTEQDLYFLYNRKKGVTSGVVEYADKVVIVRQSQSYAQSYLISHLNNEEYTQSNWAGSGRDLVIKVCDRVSDGSLDYADVLVYVDGPNNIDCDDIVDTPSPSLINASPSSTPTLSLMPSSESTLLCYDALLPVPYNGSVLSCENIFSFGGCAIQRAQTHCPNTCNACTEYKCEDSLAPFSINGRSYFCSYLQDFLSDAEIEEKCELLQLATTCRGTCKICDI